MVKKFGDPFTWSATNIGRYSLCSRLFYYENFYSKIKEIPITKPIAVGLFVHRWIEKFWVEDNGKIKPKYKSPNAFVNAAVANYKHNILNRNNKRIQGRIINFKENEIIKSINEIKSLCYKFAEMQFNSEPPLLVEQKFRFVLEEKRFSGKIDEIRKNFIIRDYKTGFRIPPEATIAYNQQFTLYDLAFGCLANKKKDFADICGVPKEDREKLAGNPYYFYDKTTLEFFNIRNMKIIITKREDSHYNDFIKSIENLETKLQIAYQLLKEGGTVEEAFPRERSNCEHCYIPEYCDSQSLAITVPKNEFKQSISIQHSLFDKISQDKIIVPEIKLSIIKPKKTRKRSRQTKLDFKL